MQIEHVYPARCLNCTDNDHMYSHVTLCEVGGANGVIWAVGVIDNDQEAAASRLMPMKGDVRGCAGVSVHIPCAASLAKKRFPQTAQQGQGKGGILCAVLHRVLEGSRHKRAAGCSRSEHRAAAVQEAMRAFRKAFV
jgi:hypothetical protein